jgi:ribosomal protein L11 methylase PrmA
MSLKYQNPGSFRDPHGSVFQINGRVFRGIKEEKVFLTTKFLDSELYKRNAKEKIVETKVISNAEIIAAGLPRDVVNSYQLWVEHQPIALITYPYEWSFEFLRRAAVFYLDLYIEALQNGFQLKDSSAYNIQFTGCNPVFIDTLSFEPYEQGNRWVGYKQFCEQFLAPLALTSYAGVDFNAYLRGSPDGLSIVDASKLLPLKSYLSLTLLGNIHLHAMAMSKISSASSWAEAKGDSQIPKRNLVALLESLKNFIAKLKIPKESYWNSYDLKNSYSEEGTKEKETIVKNFVASQNLKVVLDVGCNTGHFSEVALKSGANKVIGLDIDSGAVNLASKRVYPSEKLFTPLLFDFTNPSPSMGWRLKERASFEERMPKIDGVICLALIHHLVIGKNIPIEDFVEWIAGISPRGIVEFVPKEDEMVTGLLSSREDVFPNYSEEYFVECLKQYARIERILPVKNSKRKLFLYGEIV